MLTLFAALAQLEQDQIVKRTAVGAGRAARRAATCRWATGALRAGW
ncbi:MAG: hypothetical protein HGA19_05975 [Oscillochloris sp.]|nr:hypothetical protein [Oscillochloris sp.]